MWKDVAGYEGIYQISPTGKVRSLDRFTVCKNGKIRKQRGKILSDNVKSNGYMFVRLHNNGEAKNVHIHRLVACTFINNHSNLSDVNHIDGDKSNNNVSNLEWVTHSYNVSHAYATGLKARGENHVQSKISNDTVAFIRENYKPFDPVYGAKPLAERFNIGKPTVSSIARGLKRRAG